MSGVSERLRVAAAPIWEAQHGHPFVVGIGDGSLELERFRFWLRQDYLFLIDYARLMALGAARAAELDTMTRFAELARAVLEDEMDLHRSYAAEFGIAAEQLEAETAAPTTQGYADFLVRTATTGDFAELVAALLPCMWGYAEIGERLARRPPPADSRYAAWIEMYSAPDFGRLAGWCRELTDRVGAGLPAAGLTRMERAFVTSSRWELAFWEMAWTLERWPR
jgi:thiaminase/transcriptional activator TenA